MRFITLLFGFVTVFMLAGCLNDDSACNYFRLTEQSIVSNNYNVDSLKLYVYDSVSLYHKDTVIINAGTWLFEPEDDGYCKFSGTAVFTESGSGQSHHIPYSLTGYPTPDYPVAYFHFPVSLDGFSDDLPVIFCLGRGFHRLFMYSGEYWGPQCYPGHTTGPVKRSWIFVLSVKP